MLLKINEQKEILEYATIGGMEGAIEFDGVIPDGFEQNFKPSFYMLQDEVIVENSDYVEPSDIPPVIGPSGVQEAINRLGEVTAKITANDMQIKSALNNLGQAVAELQKSKEVK